MQVDEDLMSIPVNVFTVDQQAELDCLKVGAMDFIPKPYPPDIEIVKARDRQVYRAVENRDPDPAHTAGQADRSVPL